MSDPSASYVKDYYDVSLEEAQDKFETLKNKSDYEIVITSYNNDW